MCLNFAAKVDWEALADSELKEALGLKTDTGVARNVILFLGDGMGVSTVTAARILKGQKKGFNGEEENLTFDKFPHVALAKVMLWDYPRLSILCYSSFKYSY